MLSQPTPNTLEKIALFKGLEDRHLNWLVEHLHCKLFEAETNLITVGQPGDVVFFIIDGTVKVHSKQATGTDVVLAILGSGDIVGEMSLLDSAGRSADVITLEESTVLWMDREHFQEALHHIPQFSINLFRLLAQRLRLANAQIQTLATLDVYGRIARQLLAFAEKYGEPGDNGSQIIPIRLTQGDIADLVGASRKRVNQVMVKFKTYHYISVDALGHVTVQNHDALKRFC